MKQSKIKVITDYLKQYQPFLIEITNVKKKKNNFIVKCIINSMLFKDDTNLMEPIIPNITEQKTYLIPTKDIKPLLPKKRKLPKIKKIHIS